MIPLVKNERRSRAAGRNFSNAQETAFSPVCYTAGDGPLPTDRIASISASGLIARGSLGTIYVRLSCGQANGAHDGGA